MSDPKLPIVWRREQSHLVHLNYVSDDGRWAILHPKNATSDRWELYEHFASMRPWQGDYPTLNAAKQRAAQIVRMAERMGLS